MDEKQAQGTAHRVMIQGRHSGTISGVSDVLSFDLNEIVLQTTGASYEPADTGKRRSGYRGKD